MAFIIFLDLQCDSSTSPKSMAEFEYAMNAAKIGSEEFKATGVAFAFWIFKHSKDDPSYLDALKYFEILDTLLIVYGPDEDINNIIQNSENYQAVISENFDSTKKEFPSIDSNSILSVKHNGIIILNDPSLSLFKKNMVAPILIKDLISDWPALTKWKSPSFWLNTAGHRFFPVEIGKNYLSENWKQDIMQLKQYFDNYIFSTDPENIAYIAQHNWLHQIPSLSQDFSTPDLCEIYLNPNQDRPLIHMWFGIKGAFSPLHFDKYNNIFTQIVGYKYFLLVDPRFSEVIKNGSDNNTCTIESENLFNFLNLRNIPYNEIILKPGDSLFIPKNWWHQVKSLSFSISISFWF